MHQDCSAESLQGSKVCPSNNKKNRVQGLNFHLDFRSLQKSVVYKSWYPSQTEISYLLQHPKRREVNSSNRIGLRGLLNLGSTCFMNCIVQVLIHTPLLRDYFLSEKHHCQQTAKCLVCEISKLFQVLVTSKYD